MHRRLLLFLFVMGWCLSHPHLLRADDASPKPPQQPTQPPAQPTAQTAPGTPTPEPAVEDRPGLNLLHYLSYDSSERRSDAESASSMETVVYGAGLDLSNTEVTDQ